MNMPVNMVTPAGDELAGRFSRLVARIIDSVINAAFAGPMVLILLRRRPNLLEEIYDPSVFLWLSVPPLIFHIAIHSYFWATRGQSIGKMALGIKIVRIDGTGAGWGRIVGLRVLPIRLIGLVPLLGGIVGLVDILLIFRENKRCLHDEFAGTKVVRVVERVSADHLQPVGGDIYGKEGGRDIR